MLCTWLPAGDKHKICFLELSEISSPPFFFFFLPHCLGYWNFPDQRLNLCPLHCKHRALTVGPPKKSCSPKCFWFKVWIHRAICTHNVLSWIQYWEKSMMLFMYPINFEEFHQNFGILLGVVICMKNICHVCCAYVCEIFQARILEWVAISYSKESFWLRNRTCVYWVSCFGRQILYHCATWQVPCLLGVGNN